MPTNPKGYERNWFNNKFAELRELYGNRCFFNNCDCSGELQFAHVIPTQLSGRGRGKKHRYYDIKNNPLSYLLTCAYHNRFAEVKI